MNDATAARSGSSTLSATTAAWATGSPGTVGTLTGALAVLLGWTVSWAPSVSGATSLNRSPVGVVPTGVALTQRVPLHAAARKTGGTPPGIAIVMPVSTPPLR